MITTGDIADILIEDLKSYGFSAFKSGALPLGELTNERVIVIPKRGASGKFWTKSFSEINVCVPDILILSLELIKRQKAKIDQLEHDKNL